jgi:hypothetical protein
MRYIIQISLIFVMLAMTGCNLLPFRIRASNPPASPMTQVATSVDRTAHGLTSIPTNRPVVLESKPAEDCYALLHYYGAPSCPIALCKTFSSDMWIEEQEIFTGPNLDANAARVFHEAILLPGFTPSPMKD